MTESLLEIAKVVATVVTAIVAAILASWLTLRRTKQERLWQAKYLAYERILQAIENIRFWADATYGENMLLPSGWDQADRQEYFAAKRALTSYVHVGELLVSSGSRLALFDLLINIWAEESRVDDEGRDESNEAQVLARHADNMRHAVEKHLPGIMYEARTDLGLPALEGLRLSIH